MGFAWRIHRGRKALSRLTQNYGQTTLFAASFILFSTCFFSLHFSRLQFSTKPAVAVFEPDVGRDPAQTPAFTKNVGPQPLSVILPLDSGRRHETQEMHVGPVQPSEVMTTEKSTVIRKKPMQSLSKYLGFTTKTALNFMHFHKTGGVSFKVALYGFFDNKKKENGAPVHVRDACYEQEFEGQLRWRCDWTPVWKMTEAERNKFDVTFGHQYRYHGVEEFLNKRDVRTFSVIRHPFDRKVSFYFHFFVREAQKKENNVAFAEIRDFLLYEKIPKGAEAGWDIGPNYMAGRLLSTDVSDFVGDSRRRYYEVKPENEKKVVEKSLEIMRKYVFIGLQSESEASKCMLKKTVQAFNVAHHIDNSHTEEVTLKIPIQNAGSYAMSAGKIWSMMSPEERKIFNHEERVDLAIYYEGERLFKEQVRLFKCDHLVKKTQLLPL